jgi:hypothetical protein
LVFSQTSFAYPFRTALQAHAPPAATLLLDGQLGRDGYDKATDAGLQLQKDCGLICPLNMMSIK